MTNTIINIAIKILLGSALIASGGKLINNAKNMINH